MSNDTNVKTQIPIKTKHHRHHRHRHHLNLNKRMRTNHRSHRKDWKPSLVLW